MADTHDRKASAAKTELAVPVESWRARHFQGGKLQGQKQDLETRKAKKTTKKEFERAKIELVGQSEFALRRRLPSVRGLGKAQLPDQGKRLSGVVFVEKR